MLEYTGYIRQIRYYSESSYYIVALIEVEQEEKPFVMTGYMQNYNDYDKYLFQGDYIIHPKYGKQFKLESYQVIYADDYDEIIKYLSSSLFKGIGKVQAKAIVDYLGKDAIEKIKEDKHVLDFVRGMSETKRDTIYEVLTNNDYDHEVMQFFMGHGISLKNLSLIQAVYKEKTLAVLQNNPYQLIDDIDGIGFKTADDLALKIGMDANSPLRLKAAIVYSVKQSCFQSGSTYVTYDEIKYQFSRLIFHLDEETFSYYFEELLEEEKIIQEDDRFYDQELYEAERNIASYLNHLMEYPKTDISDDEIINQIERMQESKNIVYASKQVEAITSFLRYPCMILTGGPGTGKTTIVQALLEVYANMYPEMKIGLVAPTGRASKRLSLLSDMYACTIHRLLKWDLHTNTFMVNKNNPLELDVLIIDEFSMVDCLLLSKLLDAGTHLEKILFIGDYHQLPSVSPGNVLKDLMSTNIKQVELTEIFRQAATSGIIQLAHQILDPEQFSMDIFKSYLDIHFYSCQNVEMVYNVTTIVKKALAQGYTSSDIQVLAPMYQGVAGIDALNDALQDVFNPRDTWKEEIQIGRKIYREGDKILQLKNRVEDDVFNGDIGILVEINKKDNFEYLEDTLVVDFDGNIVTYTSSTFATITHAYCMSIHKSQGSEFKIVILSVLNDYYVMLRQNLIYTAITRAKQSLFVLGQKNAFLKSVFNNQDTSRKTTLSNRFLEKELSLYDFEQ